MWASASCPTRWAKQNKDTILWTSPIHKRFCNSWSWYAIVFCAMLMALIWACALCRCTDVRWSVDSRSTWCSRASLASARPLSSTPCFSQMFVRRRWFLRLCDVLLPNSYFQRMTSGGGVQSQRVRMEEGEVEISVVQTSTSVLIIPSRSSSTSMFSTCLALGTRSTTQSNDNSAMIFKTAIFFTDNSSLTSLCLVTTKSDDGLLDVGTPWLSILRSSSSSSYMLRQGSIGLVTQD